MKVLITGGSGLVGMALTKKLKENNIEVAHLTRTKNSKAGVKTYEWNWEKNQIDDNALNDVTHIVHLAGAGIADKPWTMKRKRLIVKSRVLTARLLHDTCKKKGVNLAAFISASGIGYYGAITSETIFKEDDKRGDDFVAECCVQWEKEVNRFEEFSRVAILRTGIVLSKDGGALEKLSKSIKLGMGAPIGTGEQYMPWIHLDDIVDMYYQSIVNEKFTGIYNAVSDEHVSNQEFTKKLADGLNKKLRLPNVPAFMMKMLLGEMSEILLNGSRVSNDLITENGFEMKYKNLVDALQDIYS